jgi:virulence-associated protein VapD
MQTTIILNMETVALLHEGYTLQEVNERVKWKTQCSQIPHTPLYKIITSFYLKKQLVRLITLTADTNLFSYQ